MKNVENAIKAIEKEDAVRATRVYKVMRFILELTAVIILTCVSLTISAAVVMGMVKFVLWTLGAQGVQVCDPS